MRSYLLLIWLTGSSANTLLQVKDWRPNLAELLVVRHGQAPFGADNYDKLPELGDALRAADWIMEHRI